SFEILVSMRQETASGQRILTPLIYKSGVHYYPLWNRTMLISKQSFNHATAYVTKEQKTSSKE
ncbi:hypothetical protein, partial [Prevotella multiformis]|uniref:hypothetical protein n=1 Tax=Prevotella multiformis TaxID=282402 RepID=UPI001C54D920